MKQISTSEYIKLFKLIGIAIHWKNYSMTKFTNKISLREVPTIKDNYKSMKLFEYVCIGRIVAT